MKEEDERANNHKQPKRRWTREEKALQRERKKAFQQDNNITVSQKKPKSKKPTKVKPLSLNEKLLHCAKNALFTNSVDVRQLAVETEKQQQQEESCIHVKTYCQQEPSLLLPPPPTTHVMIHVQPLLILDLNGILCHRIRHERHCPTTHRPSVAHVANTPIIPRVDLQTLLAFLDCNFCLAVWTSAKAKTAKQLVSLLIPEHVQERLLFVWAQSKCHTIYTGGEDKKPLFQKPLSLVWNEYPLWNSENTFLMDDSPKKCGMEFSYNTLHPPPLHGRHYFPLSSNSNTVDMEMSDLENEERQLQFFQQLVEEIDSERGDMLAFLEKAGRGHMGWRGPSMVVNGDTLSTTS